MTDLQQLKLAAPAHRALANAGIETFAQLSKKTEKEVMELHGMGKNAMAKIKDALREKGLAFRS